MEIIPVGRPSKRAPESWFTGTVWQDPILDAPEPGRVNSIRVSFEPGARTHWHTHPYGQTLHILSGVGRVQSRGGAVREVRAGDTVWFAPGEEHWHGAAPETGMVHLAIQERRDGKAADWLEPVSDADYLAEPG
jgi:quercetin dioxygenase-like cupin family protein